MNENDCEDADGVSFIYCTVSLERDCERDKLWRWTSDARCHLLNKLNSLATTCSHFEIKMNNDEPVSLFIIMCVRTYVDTSTNNRAITRISISISLMHGQHYPIIWNHCMVLNTLQSCNKVLGWSF